MKRRKINLIRDMVNRILGRFELLSDLVLSLDVV
jgi:hypothetical protein